MSVKLASASSTNAESDSESPKRLIRSQLWNGEHENYTHLNPYIPSFIKNRPLKRRAASKVPESFGLIAKIMSAIHSSGQYLVAASNTRCVWHIPHPLIVP